ncbi:hypothetical protein F5146DRAFT_1169748 [Armillaria mellea]|nr:hypothetical protein F5146DRAFT_1169748 [Armillaria mellea]
MATQTDIPTSLTDSDLALFTHIFDSGLNSRLLFSQLFGIYTGIFAVTIWNVAMSKSQHIGRPMPMVVAIILLYILTFVTFTFSLHIMVRYTSHGQTMWMRYLSLTGDHIQVVLGSIGEGTTGMICNVLGNSIMIWRCWMVWGQHYSIVVLPSLCLAASIVFKVIDMRLVFVDGNDTDLHNLMLYATFSLTTTIWCTLLIVYRILSVGKASSGAEGGLGAYRHVIEVLVESSALYSVCVIVHVACLASNPWGAYYTDILAGISKGIAPTLLIGRVAAGHARPDDSWHGSIVSSLRFGQLGGRNQTSTQDSMIAINLDDDLEAQGERTDEPDSEHVQTSSQRAYSDDVEAQQEEVEIEHDATGPGPVVPGQ